MKVKVNYRHVTRYSDEEKIRLFKEGMIRNMSNLHESRKKYTRKIKHTKREVD